MASPIIGEHDRRNIERVLSFLDDVAVDVRRLARAHACAGIDCAECYPGGIAGRIEEAAGKLRLYLEMPS
jgi:hypothetical protein